MRKYKIFMFGVSIAMLLALVAYNNPFVLGNLLVNSNYNFIIAGFFVAFLTMVLGVLKWKLLLKKVGFVVLFPIQILGFTVSNFTPGKVAEPAKTVILKMRTGIPVSTSLTSIIWERLIDVMVLVLFAAITISSLSLSSEFFVIGLLSICIFSAIILISVAVLFNKRFGIKIFYIIKKLPVLKRLPENFMDLFYKVRIDKIALSKCFITTLIAWTGEGLVLYFTLLAFGVQINPVILAGIVALSVVIGIASSLPGGLGTTEIVMAVLLGLVGVENSIAVTAAITFRFMTFWFVNLVGGLSFIYLSRKFELKNII